MNNTQAVGLVLGGSQYDLCVSEISKAQFERWSRDGFPDDYSEDYDNYLDASESTYECGLIPNNNLSLLVEGVEIEKLHKKINDSKNFHIMRNSVRITSKKYYLLTVNYEIATYSLTVPAPFDFRRLEWSAEIVTLPIFGEHELLTVTYGGEYFEFEDSRRKESNQQLLQAK